MARKTLSDQVQALTGEVAALKKMLEIMARSGIGSGRLQAQSLSVMCSSRTRCNANCRFCISRTTEGGSTNGCDVRLLDFNRLNVGLDFATRCNASTAILTGKADPLQEDPVYLCNLARACRSKGFAVDMHTNGFGFRNGGRHSLANLNDAGLTMITFSIASFDAVANANLMGANFARFSAKDLIREAADRKLLVRCSLVLNRQGVYTLDGIRAYIQNAKEAGAKMVVIRELWLPNVNDELKDNDVYRWNEENRVSMDPFVDQVWELTRQAGSRCFFRRYLPWGTPIFDIDGMNVTFARCEESFAGGTAKSLVHKDDGHGYLDWEGATILY